MDISVEKNGKVVSIKVVEDKDEVMIITQSGIVIRTPAKGISVIGRATKGVRVIRIGEGDRVTSVALIRENGD